MEAITTINYASEIPAASPFAILIIHKNSLWGGLNIQKRKLCVKGNLAQDLGSVWAISGAIRRVFGVEEAKSSARGAIRCFEDLRLK